MKYNPCSLSFTSDRGERHGKFSRDNVDGGSTLEGVDPDWGGGREAICPEEVTKLRIMKRQGQEGWLHTQDAARKVDDDSDRNENYHTSPSSEYLS